MWTREKVEISKTRKRRNELMAEVKQSLQEVFEMRTNSNTYVLPLHETWREYSPGVHCRSLPTIKNGLSLILWEFEEDTEFPKHCHDSEETFYMVRGVLVINDGHGKLMFALNDSNNRSGTVPCNMEHIGIVKAGSIVLSKYIPPMVIEKK